MRNLIVAGLAVAMLVSAAQAAFIVEPHSSGKAFANFSYLGPTGAPSYSTTKGTAPGLVATSSAFGGSGAAEDRYIFSYTPGVDADNTVFSAGDPLGTHKLEPTLNLVAEAQTATGLVGGATGLYKVYITWPKSGNVNTAGSTITVYSDGAPIELTPVSQNGDPAFSSTYTEVGAAGTNKWLCIGTVQLTAGVTYKVEQLALSLTYVSQRSAGVMWELVPEPATAMLLSLGGLFLRRRRA